MSYTHMAQWVAREMKRSEFPYATPGTSLNKIYPIPVTSSWLYTVRSLCEVGRFDELCTALTKDAKLNVAKAVVDAHTILASALETAIEAYGDIPTKIVIEDWQGVQVLAQQASWLAERQCGDLVRYASTGSKEGCLRTVRAMPAVDALPKTIGELSDGQVARIAQRNNMSLEAMVVKAERRTADPIVALTDLDLGPDLNKVMTEAVKVRDRGNLLWMHPLRAVFGVRV